MEPTISTVGDQMPKTGTLIKTTRKKLTHSVGCVGKFQLTSTGDHPFSGIFSSGTDLGIMRISVAAEPDPSVDNIIPAMSLKFLRDGIDSANVVLSNYIDGQSSWNMFATDWSNHIGASHELYLKTLCRHFMSVTRTCEAVGISDIASYNLNGTAVDDIVFPYQLRFSPTDAV